MENNTGKISIINSVPTEDSATPLSAVTLRSIEKASTLAVQVVGTYTGALTVQARVKGSLAWVSLAGISVRNAATGVSTATIPSAAPGLYVIDISAFGDVRVTALSAVTGTANISMTALPVTSTVSLGSPIPTGSNTIGTVNVAGSAATNLGKVEDSVAASGDVGIANLGVRVPATPAAQTSAASDYGMLAIDAEGKLIASQYSASEHYWQSTALTLSTTASTAVKTAAAAGVRNYITDIDIANTSATGVRVDVLDGSTAIAQFWSPPTSHIHHSYSVPKRTTAATALNVQLSAAVTDVRVSANGYIGI